MGIVGFPDIFQAKMMELMVTLEFINDLLCITKETQEDLLDD